MIHQTQPRKMSFIDELLPNTKDNKDAFIIASNVSASLLEGVTQSITELRCQTNKNYNKQDQEREEGIYQAEKALINGLHQQKAFRKQSKEQFLCKLSSLKPAERVSYLAENLLASEDQCLQKSYDPSLPHWETRTHLMTGLLQESINAIRRDAETKWLKSKGKPFSERNHLLGFYPNPKQASKLIDQIISIYKK
jgi:hypothetical protein